MLNLAAIFPEQKDIDDGFPRKFNWLMSPYEEDSWIVRDPFSVENTERKTIYFDGVLSESLCFRDVDGLIDDLKRSLIVAVVLGKTINNFGSGVQSLSSMRHHVNNLQRVFRCIWNLGYTSPNDIDKNDLADVIDKLSERESIALSYPQRLTQYFESKNLESIPVKLVNDKRYPSSIDRDKVYLECGIYSYAARNCPDCREVIQYVHEELALLYDKPFEQLVFEKRAAHCLSKKSFQDNLKALRIFANQSIVEGLFKNNLLVHQDDFNNDQIESIKRKLAAAGTPKRTRNIEVDIFLTVMDAAARYVTDYSDALFQHHDYLVSNQTNYSDKSNPTKLMGSTLKKTTQGHNLANLPASPFPLAGLNTVVPGKSKFSTEEKVKIIALANKKKKSKEIADSVNLTAKEVQNFLTQRERYGRHLPSSGVSLYDAMFCYLPLSCALILLAFTAGREKGIYSLKPDCIKETEGELWIEMYVSKTLRQNQWFPAVKLMEMAVNVLKKLSDQYRTETGEDTLFRFKSPLFYGTNKLNFDETVRRFCTSALNLSEELGDSFKFSEHQFRRFFAIMYFYRYEAGNFEALSYHLRHLNYHMTAVYLTEQEQGRILRDVQDEKVKRLAKRAMNGDKSLSGAMVDDLIALFSEQLLVEGAQFEDEIETLYEGDSDLVIDFPHAKGLCFGRTPRFVERAKCKVERDGKILASILSSSESLCKGCPNFLGIDTIKGNYIPAKASQEIFKIGGNLLGAAIRKGSID